MQTMERRGQVSIFMIIGIVLLLVSSFIIYIQKYAITRQSELQMRESAIVDGDMDAFEGYVGSAFESSVYASLELWGGKGGFDDTSTDLPKKTYDYDVVGIRTNGETIVYLYDNGNDLLDAAKKEQTMKNLTSFTESVFLSSIDTAMFEEKGYGFSYWEQPNVDVYPSEQGGLTTFVLQPNMHIGVGRFALIFSNFTTQVPIGITEVELEISSILNSFQTRGSPYDFGSYAPLSSKIKVCGYADGVDSVIRLTYDEPFLQNENYNFTFLAKIDATGCTP